MNNSFSLTLDLDKATHRQAVDWLKSRPDASEAVVELILSVNAAEQRLFQLEEMASLLQGEVKQLRSLFNGKTDTADTQEIEEDPESARRLDSMFAW
ncbi:MAG: hypothetical protein JW981_10685 [Anaerolineae bacterium]|nr:hypothetical protein [Anaerolineae bacterium]